MSGLMGALLAAGSRVRAGFEYSSVASSADSIAGYDSPGNIQSVLTGAMLGSGVFSDAFVDVKEPGWAGLQHGYITASGTTYQDVGDPYDISTLIRGLIETYLPVLTVTRQDAVAVDAIPAAQQGKPGVQQVYNPNAVQTQPNQPGQCSWSKQSFGDFIACELGINSPISGVGVGAVGALVGVGVLTLIAVVALKRF
jgi:hypothetical protein